MPSAEKINGPVDTLYSGNIYYKPYLVKRCLSPS